MSFVLTTEFGIVYDTDMRPPRIVIDTNVLIASLRSQCGASYQLVMLLGCGKIDAVLSVPLVTEYEAAAKRLVEDIHLTIQDIDDILDYICSVATPLKIFYLWRPCLKDPKDDMVLELAVSGGCDAIVTYNKKDFQGAEKFGIPLMSAKEFLQAIGELP